MIIRILSDGQYAVDDAHAALLNGLDTGLERAVEAGDEAGFRSALAEILAQVRTVGERPVANALGTSVSAMATFGLGMSASAQRRSTIACSCGASSGVTSRPPIE